jgi:hypothetical protein
MQTLLMEIARDEGIKLDSERTEKNIPQFTWEGGLEELKHEYTSLELQKKVLDWR